MKQQTKKRNKPILYAKEKEKEYAATDKRTLFIPRCMEVGGMKGNWK